MEEKEKTGRAKAYFRELLDIRGDMMGYEEIDAMMLENTAIHGSNMWILMLAIFIASIGLNVNSTAVIIGAMLISPLMSGILTLGYSLAVKDLALMRRSLASFGTQVAISLIASTLYFLLTPLQEPTAEMIARTSPTIWDVLIALFGGIAGMIGNTRQKKGNVIPGVAIATALMPPLCTAGYGLATLQPRFLLGAFYLFAINTLFIALSAALVTVLLRVPAHREISPRRQKKINRIIVSITVITVIPSILIGGMTVYNSVMDSNIERYLKSEFVFSDTQLVQSSTDKMEKKISVSLVGQPVSQEAIAMLQKELANYGLEGYTLHVTQNSVSADPENSDRVTIALQENAISALQEKLEEKERELDAANRQLEEMRSSPDPADKLQALSAAAPRIFTKLETCSVGYMSDSEGEFILLTASASEPMSAGEIETLENWLRTETGLDRVTVYID
ncbi:MAG: DUF389 domain-containing protein [Clostridiales bacterium]|nr:DUF389 domain-containing protein [Clostridiales bacterium]